ncbi:hypothetical protein KAX17_06445, partial [Candidatus Bipolaricaulota bacterium]|nr:hypothetical protein [Candidatus Bipolaricaulota bacterium]
PGVVIVISTQQTPPLQIALATCSNCVELSVLTTPITPVFKINCGFSCFRFTAISDVLSND